MRRALKILPVLFAGLLLLEGAAPALAGSAKQGEAARVQFTGVTQSGQEQHGQHFAAAGLRSLLINVQWRTLVGAHTQRLELITPDGSVYQTLTTPVESVTGTAVAETRLPVSGTWITEYSLHGHWKVNVYLDDAVRPVTTADFTLAE